MVLVVVAVVGRGGALHVVVTVSGREGLVRVAVRQGMVYRGPGPRPGGVCGCGCVSVCVLSVMDVCEWARVCVRGGAGQGARAKPPPGANAAADAAAHGGPVRCGIFCDPAAAGTEARGEASSD